MDHYLEFVDLVVRRKYHLLCSIDFVHGVRTVLVAENDAQKDVKKAGNNDHGQIIDRVWNVAELKAKK